MVHASLPMFNAYEFFVTDLLRGPCRAGRSNIRLCGSYAGGYCKSYLQEKR